MNAAKYLYILTLLSACGAVEPEAHEPSAEAALPAARHDIAFVNDAVDGYIAWLPEGYSPGRTYPMIVAFHGAVGSAETAFERWAEPSAGFILVCPQGTARMGWQIGTGQLPSILACIDDAAERFHVDAERVYVTGHSMGGHVSWNLAIAHAERFAAIAPTASTPMSPDGLDGVLGLPLYVVHGRNDGIVNLAKNQEAEEYINANGGSMTLMIIEAAGHGFVMEQRDDIVEFFEENR